MRGIFWNIRELGKADRKQCIIKTIRKNAVDFIGIQETKSVAFSDKYLESLTSGNVGIGYLLMVVLVGSY
jgi:hypothetical protein